MQGSMPAIWSAVAATFSAVTAFVVMRIQRRSLLESVRPELILLDWQIDTATEGHEVISFGAVRNVGRGAALHVYINCSLVEADLPLVSMGTLRVPIVAPGDTASFDGQVNLWWKNVKSQPLPFGISVMCWDVQNLRHYTTYDLLAVPIASWMQLGDSLIPGVVLTRRTTRSDAAWLMKCQGRLGRVGDFGRKVSQSIWYRWR